MGWADRYALSESDRSRAAYKVVSGLVSHTKHIWYSEHGTYYRFKLILERAMSVTHVAVILCMRTGPAYEEESMKTDYPDARNEYSMS